MQNYENKEFVPIRIASNITGIKEQTLRKLHEENVLKGYRTPANQRMFSVECLQDMCKTANSSKKPEIKDRRVNVLYTRVSSAKQKDDLERQVKFINEFKRDGIDYMLISDIGSGINFNRKGINTILELCLQGIIGEVTIAHRDRLSRFGFELFNSIITKSGGSIRVIDDDKNKSTEQELAEDLLSIVHIYSCKQMGRRSYATKKQREDDSKIIENKDEFNDEPEKVN
jgi:predicted site-specific integrase-resolvase